MRSNLFLVSLVVAAGLLVGALVAAWHDGQISLASLSERHAQLAAMPVCNPNDVTGVDLDGELPGGG